MSQIAKAQQRQLAGNNGGDQLAKLASHQNGSQASNLSVRAHERKLAEDTGAYPDPSKQLERSGQAEYGDLPKKDSEDPTG